MNQLIIMFPLYGLDALATTNEPKQEKYINQYYGSVLRIEPWIFECNKGRLNTHKPLVLIGRNRQSTHLMWLILLLDLTLGLNYNESLASLHILNSVKHSFYRHDIIVKVSKEATGRVSPVHGYKPTLVASTTFLVMYHAGNPTRHNPVSPRNILAVWLAEEATASMAQQKSLSSSLYQPWPPLARGSAYSCNMISPSSTRQTDIKNLISIMM